MSIGLTPYLRRSFVSGDRITRRQWIERSARLACLGVVASGTNCGRRRRTPQSDTVTILYPEDDAVLGPGDDVAAQHLMFLPLVTYNARGEVEGRLAESWKHTPDYRSWTVRLRDGIRWHDGVPVTAHDIKFTLDLLIHPDVHWYPPGTYSSEVVDDHTYTITYQQNGLAAGVRDDWRVYYPKHLLERLDPKEFETWDFWKHPVGNGPFRYVRHVPKTMMQLEANPDYYRGKPKIANLVLKLANWGSGSMAELLSGDVDAASYISRTDVRSLGLDGRFSVYQQLDHNSVGVLCWNQHHPLFKESKVRKALTLAIDRSELAQVLNYPQDTPVLDAPLSRRQLQRREFADPIPYNPGVASRLLNEAGWAKRNRHGIRERDGRVFDFVLICSSDTGPWNGLDSAVYISAQLSRIGVRANIEPIEGGTHWNRVVAGDYQAAISRMATGWGDAPGPRNFLAAAGYADPRFLRIEDTIDTIHDPDHEDHLYREMTRLFQEDVPATFLYPTVWTTVASDRIRGLDLCPYRGEATRCMDSLSLEGLI